MIKNSIKPRYVQHAKKKGGLGQCWGLEHGVTNSIQIHVRNAEGLLFSKAQTVENAEGSNVGGGGIFRSFTSVG